MSCTLAVWFNRNVKHIQTFCTNRHIFWDTVLNVQLHYKNSIPPSFWNMSFLFVQLMGATSSQPSSRTVTFKVVSAEGERTPWLTAERVLLRLLCVCSLILKLFPAVNSYSSSGWQWPDTWTLLLTGWLLRPVACCRDVMRSSVTPAALCNRVICRPSG